MGATARFEASLKLATDASIIPEPLRPPEQGSHHKAHLETVQEGLPNRRG